MYKNRLLVPYPILRLVVPMSAGIFFMNTFHLHGFAEVYLMLAIGCLLCMTWMLFSRSYSFRWLFGAVTFILFFLLGCWRMDVRWQEVEPRWSSEWQTYEGVLLEKPQVKARSYLCKVRVQGKNVLLYMPKDSAVMQLTSSEHLLFQTRIQPPSRLDKMPDFDYASYLLMKGISGTSYVPSGKWEKLDIPSKPTLKQRALSVREKIVDLYREWGIGEEQLPVLSALTVGYKEDLSDELREAYSISGIAHVLALSGMHIGFLWMGLSFLLRPMEKKSWMRVCRWFVSTLLLWAFAFIAGLEASVVRAVVMCMLMELGRLRGNHPLSMNTLAVAAFFMLLYNPFYLYDVSFQLSFMAVGTIFLCYPMIYRCLTFRRKVWSTVWGIASASLSAQIGTAPLVMYYFNNFSVYFLFANLVVAFWVPLIIFLAFACLLLAPITWIHGGMIWLLDKVIRGLDQFAFSVSGLPFASLDGIRMEVWEVWGVYLILGLLWWYAKLRRRKLLIASLFVVALCLGVRTFLLYRTF